MSHRLKALVGLSLLLFGLGHHGAASAFKLITEEEAKLPDDVIQDRLRDPFPGPVINIVGCPKEAYALPVELTVELKAFAGANIDMDSLRVVYMKQPRVNLTPRIREANAIRQSDNKVVIAIQNAEIPPGQHQIQVWAKDSRNKDSETYLSIDVQPQQGRPVWSWSSNSRRRSWFDAIGGCG